MRTLRCRCGERVCWTSMGVADCQGCTQCGTTYAGHPDGHRPLQDCDFSVKRYDNMTGEPYLLCSKCHRSERSVALSRA